MTENWSRRLTRGERIAAGGRRLILVPFVAALAVPLTLPASAQIPAVHRPNIFHRPETQRMAALAAAGPAANLEFHGGPVMTSFTAYLIFWLPPGVHYSSSLGD